MSYILEALKKADAERNGATPQTIRPPLLVSSSARRSAWRSPWPWLILSALTLATAGTLWLRPWQNMPAPATVAQAPTQPALVIPPAVVETLPPEVTPSRPAPKSKETVAAKAPDRKPPAKKTVEKPAQKQTPPAEPPVATLRELPAHIRSEIPPLSVGGYIYSGNKADRSVLINKRLLREGDEAAPGLVLETMLPNGMIFRYKGYRYRTGY
ncbi:MAG TPA: general secretion pathway protein GspB [Noviherbaspirillum sp.]